MPSIAVTALTKNLSNPITCSKILPTMGMYEPNEPKSGIFKVKPLIKMHLSKSYLPDVDEHPDDSMEITPNPYTETTRLFHPDRRLSEISAVSNEIVTENLK